MRARSSLLVAVVLLGSVVIPGCQEMKEAWDDWTRRPPPAAQKIPSPVNLLLPQKIQIHPFTGTRTFDKEGGVKGIDVQVKALDAYEDSTKAFGQFRFELYAHDPSKPSEKGEQLATWTEDVIRPRKNLLHWNKINRTYEFKLRWDKPIPVGQRFVLDAVFTSPFTQRLFDRLQFIAGE